MPRASKRGHHPPFISQGSTAPSSQNVTTSLRPFQNRFISHSSCSELLPGPPATHVEWMRKQTEKQIFSLWPNFWTKFER